MALLLRHVQIGREPDQLGRGQPQFVLVQYLWRQNQAGSSGASANNNLCTVAESLEKHFEPALYVQSGRKITSNLAVKKPHDLCYHSSGSKKARTTHSFVNACTNRFRYLNASANSHASTAASMDMQNRDKLSR